MRLLVAEVPAHPAVGIANRAVADPVHLTAGGQLIQHGRGVVRYPRRQDDGFEGTCRQGVPGQLLQSAQDRIGAPLARTDALPLRKEAGVGDLLDRLHTLAQTGERAALDQREDLCMTVLTDGRRGCLNFAGLETTGLCGTITRERA